MFDSYYLVTYFILFLMSGVIAKRENTEIHVQAPSQLLNAERVNIIESFSCASII